MFDVINRDGEVLLTVVVAKRAAAAVAATRAGIPSPFRVARYDALHKSARRWRQVDRWGNPVVNAGRR